MNDVATATDQPAYLPPPPPCNMRDGKEIARRQQRADAPWYAVTLHGSQRSHSFQVWKWVEHAASWVEVTKTEENDVLASWALHLWHENQNLLRMLDAIALVAARRDAVDKTQP